MKMNLIKWLPIILAGMSVFSCKSDSKSLDNVFYAFNNCVRTLPGAPGEFEGQADLIKRLGFDGMAGHVEDNYYELRAAMDKVALEMPEMYIGMHIKDGVISVHGELRNILQHSKDRQLLVALHLHNDGSVEDREEADQLFVDGIADLAVFAAPLNIQIAVYPHVNFWCETLSHATELAKRCSMDNVGAVFNLCHLLKVEGEAGWEQKAIDALPWLFMVSVNGADGGDTQQMGWDRLIRPLGEGTFDTYKLVKLLKDNGYEGKFGLQCYNIKQDCETALTKSMETWNSYRERYIRED